jgi:hypothetical protein
MPGEYSEVVKACQGLESKLTEIDAKIEEYNGRISTNIRGIWKGDIVGSNVIDRQVNIEEILGSEKDEKGNYVRILGEGTDNETKVLVPEITAKAIQKSIEAWGSDLHMIAYERVESSRLFGLLENKGQYIVMACADQVLGWDNEGGDIALLCTGTIRYGRFEILQGYPGRLKVMVAEINCLPWKDHSKMLISGISDITNKALDANPGFQQSVEMAEATRPVINQKVSKE